MKIIEKISGFTIWKIKFVKIVLIGLLLIIIASVVTQLPVFNTAGKDDAHNLNPKEPGTDDGSIETFTAALQEASEEIEILGQIVFKEKINISSKVTGRLSKITVHEGDRVTAGQLIAEVERLPLEITLSQQKSELEIAQKAFDLAKAKFENAVKGIEIKLKIIHKARAELNDKLVSYQNMDRILKNKTTLYEAGGLSESELKTLKTQHTTAYTAYQLAKSDLEIQLVGYRDEDIKAEGMSVPASEKEKIELFKKINTKIERAELESARSRISQAENNIQSTAIMIKETYIRSPIVGMVAARSMEAGEMIKPESIIATLINITEIYLSMNLNERDIKKVKAGQIVSFNVDALGDENFRAIVKRITPVLDMKTRTVEIKAEMKNPGYRLLPGMFARAKITTGGREKKLLIPVSALAKNEGDNGEVYIAKKGLIFKQKVSTGKEYNSLIEITDGIQENDVVISKGRNLVYEGMKLRAQK